MGPNIRKCKHCGAFKEFYGDVCSECASDIVESAPSASGNTGSPKLADDISVAIDMIEHGNYNAARDYLQTVVIQLRAGA